MSPCFAPARTSIAPVCAGRVPLPAGGIIAASTTIMTTGTGITGQRWVSVRD